MSYPKVSLDLRPKRGVASDLPPWEVGPDFFTQADNIVFRMGVAERAPSVEAVYDPLSIAPYAMLNVQIGGVNYWVYVGATAAYAVQTSVHTDITHASGQQSVADISKLSLGTLNGVPFFNNSLDEPMYWDGNPSNNFIDLPGWVATQSAEVLVAHKFHLFALGISGPGGDFPNQVLWSDAAAPGNVPASWTPAANNEAGSTTLSDTPGELVTAENLRGSLMIYKNGSTHVADYIGGQSEEIFGFRTLFVQSGALARHSVADINGRHFVVTDGDIIVTDGVNVDSIAQDRRKRFFFNQLDQDNFTQHFVRYNRAQNEVWLCFPEAGNSLCTRAMIWDVKHNSWGDRELANIAFAAAGIINDTSPDETWDVDAQVWDDDLTEWNRQSFSLATEELVLADNAASDFLRVGAGVQSLTSTLARYAADFGDAKRYKFVKRVHVAIEGETDISFAVRVGGQETTGGPITWTTAITINSDSGFADVLMMGRFISVEIAVTTTKTFKITRMDLEAEMRGYH